MKTAFVAILIVGIIGFILMKARAKKSAEPSEPEQLDKPFEYAYAAKAVMTDPEQILFFRLAEALPENVVLAQTQMSSFLKLKGRQQNWKALSSRIREKSADFLICRKDTSVLAVIELQDGTHEQPERIKSDEFKRSALKAAGIPLIEFNVSDLPSIDRIKAAVIGN